MSDIATEVRQIVRDFLQNHHGLENEWKLPEYMDFVDQKDSRRMKRVPIHVYIYAMFQTIQSQGAYMLKDGSRFSNSRLIFSMLNYAQDAKCSLGITFTAMDQPPLSDWIHQLPLQGEVQLDVPGAAKFKRYSNYLDGIDKMAKTFDHDVEMCEDRIIGIPLSISFNSKKYGHQNMLLVMKMRPDKYFVLIYEPHGSQSNLQEGVARTDFLSNLQRGLANRSTKYVFLPLETTSCPVGLQIQAGDSFGYCFMFSNFWLYCILRCLPHLIRISDVSEFQDAVRSVESTILNEVSRESLFMLVTNFAIRYCEHFWKVVERSSDQMKSFDKQMYEVLDEENPVTVQVQALPLVMSSLYVQPKSERSDDEAMLANDGDECRTSADCQSHCCHADKKVCVPVDLNENPLTAEEEKRATSEEYTTLISPLFYHGAQSTLDRDAQNKGRHLFELLECLQGSQGYVWRLMTFFLPPHVVHQICNGSFDFHPRNLQFTKNIDLDEWYSIHSSPELENLAKQMIHRNQFACSISFVCVTLQETTNPELPYHLFFMCRRDHELQLFAFSMNESQRYLTPLHMLGENLVAAMTRVSPTGSRAQWLGFVNIPLPMTNLDTSYTQTVKHLIQGLGIVFFTHFADQYARVDEALREFANVWQELCMEYQTSLEQIVCKFASDLIEQQPDMNRPCVEQQLWQLRDEA